MHFLLIALKRIINTKELDAAVCEYKFSTVLITFTLTLLF